MNNVVWHSIFALVMLGLVLLAGFIARANAQDNGVAPAANNAQHEITRCAAYFSVAHKCGEVSNAPKVVETYKKASDTMFVYMETLRKPAGMTTDAMLSRFQLELGRMWDLLQNSCTNISSAMVRHAKRCKYVAENPDKVLQSYLANGGR